MRFFGSRETKTTRRGIISLFLITFFQFVQVECASLPYLIGPQLAHANNGQITICKNVKVKNVAEFDSVKSIDIDDIPQGDQPQLPPISTPDDDNVVVEIVTSNEHEDKQHQEEQKKVKVVHSGPLIRSPQLMPDGNDFIYHLNRERKKLKKHKRRVKERCEPGKFWHIRGKRCVPIICPERSRGYGRHWSTGECANDGIDGGDGGRLMGFSGGSGSVWWHHKIKYPVVPRFGMEGAGYY